MYIYVVNKYIFSFFLDSKLRNSIFGFLLNIMLCFRDFIFGFYCYVVYLMRIKKIFIVGFYFLNIYWSI